MKIFFSFLSAALLMAALTPSVQARDSVSVDFFYDNLQQQGDWREVNGYGYCWQPRDVGYDGDPTVMGAGFTQMLAGPEIHKSLLVGPFITMAVGLSRPYCYDIGPSHYRFVENRNFGARRLNSVFIEIVHPLIIVRTREPKSQGR